MNTQARTLPLRLGKYEIRREVGRGGMGVVYEGYDPVIHRRVALKTLISELFTGPQATAYLSRLQREAQAAGRLNHPNIVAIYDFGEEPLPNAENTGSRMAFIAMEFVEGRELSSYLRDSERFSIEAITRIMSELLDALEYSHKHGVVHRDIKPANIILLADGTVKVADFGIARIESSTLTQVGTVMGSPSYMSPEQFMGQTVDGRSDLYSAAVVFYELLTGEVPFAGSFSNIMHRVLNDEPSPPSILNVQIPKSIDAVVRQAMAKRPDERFQSALAFKQAMLSVLAAAPAAAATGSQTTRNPAKPTVFIPETAIAPKSTVTRLSSPGALIVAACLVAGGAAAAYLHWNASSDPGVSRAPATSPPAVAASVAPVNGGSNSKAEANGTRPGPAPASAALAGAAATDLSPSGSSGAALPEAVSLTPGTAVVSAVGLADTSDPRFAKESTQGEHPVWGDARRQLIEKAVALYVDPSSINANYGILRDKLLSRSDQYITTVLEQSPQQTDGNGLVLGTMRATVRVRDVQKSLNQISRDERVEFIRNNGDPRIAINVRAQSALADPSLGPQRNAVAENILMERIRSFGFVAVDEQLAKPAADFLLDGEVRFKRLAARLPASGITIEKFVLTSWTIRVADAKTGEEVYHNTKIPQKQSWASEELALQEVGRLIGAEFSRDFFLQHFDFGTKKVRLRFAGLPSTAAAAVLAEANSTLRVLNAVPIVQGGGDVVIDADLSGGSDAASVVLQDSLLASLNRKSGGTCFAVTHATAAEVHIGFDPACATPAKLSRLEMYPPEAFIDSPAQRIEEVVRDPNKLRRAEL